MELQQAFEALQEYLELPSEETRSRSQAEAVQDLREQAQRLYTCAETIGGGANGKDIALSVAWAALEVWDKFDALDPAEDAALEALSYIDMVRDNEHHQLFPPLPDDLSWGLEDHGDSLQVSVMYRQVLPVARIGITHDTAVPLYLEHHLGLSCELSHAAFEAVDKVVEKLTGAWPGPDDGVETHDAVDPLTYVTYARDLHYTRALPASGLPGTLWELEEANNGVVLHLTHGTSRGQSLVVTNSSVLPRTGEKMTGTPRDTGEAAELIHLAMRMIVRGVDGEA